MRRFLTVAFAVALLFTAACGARSSSSSDGEAKPPHNPSDVDFAQMMIPHHEQAVAMSDTLLAESGVDPDVTALAQTIKTAQQPEINTMKSWLTAWGESADGGMGMGHGSRGMGGDGMATEDELKEFEQADGADAEKMYLEMMIA
ncbi:MAG TPA: DUF305 domain-containing protein, partial [Aeromicrobium sp.]|nr:DUF305 domain-containing protein [Aeromicrobium sp.]